MFYEEPVMDIIFFDKLDIITTSEITGGGLDGGIGDGGEADVNGNSRSRTDF